MSDDLRSTIEAATQEVASNEATETVQVESPVSAAPSEAPSPAPVENRADASGTGSPASPSATQKSDAPPSIEEVAGEAGQPVENKAETPEQREARHRVDRAPQSWKGDAKQLWAQLPLQVRQEVARREKDVMQVMHSAAENKHKMDAMMGVMMPHKDRILSNYGDPVRAVESLLQTEAVLHSGSQAQKAQLLTRLVQQFGVDVRALDSALAGMALPEEVQAQSNIEQLLEQKLAPFQQFLQTQQQREMQQRQQVEQQATVTVQQMAQDDRYPYFEDVRADMADIIEMNARRGVAISLQDAYTRAVRMNDGTFQASSVRDQTQGATQQALEAHRAAQAAKGASVSVSGSPTGNGRNAGDPSNLRGIIETAFGGGRL